MPSCLPQAVHSEWRRNDSLEDRITQGKAWLVSSCFLATWRAGPSLIATSRTALPAGWLQACTDPLPFHCILCLTQQWVSRLGLQGLHHVWVFSELYNCAWAHLCHQARLLLPVHWPNSSISSSEMESGCPGTRLESTEKK